MVESLVKVQRSVLPAPLRGWRLFPLFFHFANSPLSLRERAGVRELARELAASLTLTLSRGERESLEIAV